MQKKTEKTQNNSGENIKKLLKDQTEKLVEIFDDRIKTVQEGFNGINKKLDSHTKILDSHTEQIGNILVDLSTIKINVNQISYDVRMKLDNKADKKHFVDLDQRVRRLEKK